MKENIIKDKSFCFALEIVLLNKFLIEEKREYILSRQILRSGTSVGALIRESEHAESKKDFIHKLSISLKEANETDYWIELIYQSKYINHETYKKYKIANEELVKMLTAILKTSKRSLLKKE